LLVFGPRIRPVALGVRRSFADVGQTVADFLDVAPLAAGVSFLHEVWSD
jgi:phosphopentomutase